MYEWSLVFRPILGLHHDWSLPTAAQLTQVSPNRPGAPPPQNTDCSLPSTVRLPATPRRSEDLLEGTC